MQIDIAETIYERVKELPLEKQREVLRQIENLSDKKPLTIWEKIRMRSERIPDEMWAEMLRDGSEHHDRYINGVAKD
jgi:hypothetical protein